METGCVQKLFRGLAALAFCFTALPVAAVVYSSHFDPVDFSGTALFKFDDNCLLADGVHSASSCHLTLLSALVDIADDGTSGTGHLDFSNLVPDAADMVDLVIQSGELVGVNTALIGWEFASPCTGTACGVPWWIQWTSGTGLLTTALDGLNGVNLFRGNCDGDVCFPDGTPLGTAVNVTFTRVPEPATVALVLLALAAGWLSARRRARS